MRLIIQSHLQIYDFDHPDYFKSIEDVLKPSKPWLRKLNGIFAYGDDEYLRKLKADVPIYYYGIISKTMIFKHGINIVRTTNGSAFDALP